MNTAENISVYDYQRGYADGYKRNQLYNLAQKEIQNTYISNVFMITLFFMFFILCFIYVFYVRKGNCK